MKAQEINIALDEVEGNLQSEGLYERPRGAGASPGFERGGGQEIFFQIWEFACREATCCAWQSHAHC